MANFDRAFIDQVLSSTDIVDVIKEKVNLTKNGANFKGLCPFHNEKTPSFSVSDEKGLFYCFGCKVGGNALTFLTKYKNFSFIESINYLSSYLGLNISLVNSVNLEKNKSTYEILKNANDFFVLDIQHKDL